MATTAPVLWLDGALVPVKDAAIPLMAHAPQRGSLVFDVGSFHPTSRGPALFRAPEHVARFVRSAKIVGLDLPFDEDVILQAAVRVVAESGRDEGLVRWSAFYDVTEPDLVPKATAAHVAVAAQIYDTPPSQAPIRVSIFDDARKAPPEVLSPEAKAAAAYLGPMLARRRAIAAGSDDVILLDTSGDIAEAPVSNAFAVVDGALWTPPLGRILPGITRDSVIAIAKDQGIDVREAPLPLGVFRSAAEAFLTSTSAPLSPIGWIDGVPLEAPGKITKRLLERLDAARHGREREAWSTFVR